LDGNSAMLTGETSHLPPTKAKEGVGKTVGKTHFPV